MGHGRAGTAVLPLAPAGRWHRADRPTCRVHGRHVRADQRVRVAVSATVIRSVAGDGSPEVLRLDRIRSVASPAPGGSGRDRSPWRTRLELCDRRRCLGAREKGDLTGPNPVDRGKYGSKIHLITERTGLPISVGISAANLHDSQALIPLVKGIPLIRSRRGPRRRKPGKLHGDKGYDYSHLRRWLRERGITHRIARRGVESSQRLGRHRWTIERTMAWLAGCRRLHRRYERKADHFLAFTTIACVRVCYRRLAC